MKKKSPLEKAFRFFLIYMSQRPPPPNQHHHNHHPVLPSGSANEHSASEIHLFIRFIECKLFYFNASLINNRPLKNCCLLIKLYLYLFSKIKFNKYKDICWNQKPSTKLSLIYSYSYTCIYETKLHWLITYSDITNGN